MNSLKENTFINYPYFDNFSLEQKRLIEIAHSYYDGKYSPLKNGGVHVKFDENKEAGYLYQETLIFDDFTNEYIVKKEEKWNISDDITEVIREDILIMTDAEYQKWGRFGLKYEYELLCNRYIHRFSRKQELKKKGWVENKIGGVYEFENNYLFNFNDIRWDIDTNQDVNLILNWFSENKKKLIETCYIDYTKRIKYE